MRPIAKSPISPSSWRKWAGSIGGMDSLTQRMPFVTAFYRALGTGMVISVDSPIDDKVRSAMESLIED